MGQVVTSFHSKLCCGSCCGSPLDSFCCGSVPVSPPQATINIEASTIVSHRFINLLLPKLTRLLVGSGAAQTPSQRCQFSVLQDQPFGAFLVKIDLHSGVGAAAFKVEHYAFAKHTVLDALT